MNASAVRGGGLTASGVIWRLQLRPGHQLGLSVPNIVIRQRMDSIGQCRERFNTLPPI